MVWLSSPSAGSVSIHTPAGAARGVGGVGLNRLQRVAGSEQPLREKRRAAVLRVARGKCRDGRVEAEITQVGHIPVGVAAVFFRRFGEVVRREGVAVAERLPLEHLAACGKAERQVQQLLGNAIRRLQGADVGAQLRGVRRGRAGGAALGGIGTGRDAGDAGR